MNETGFEVDAVTLLEDKPCATCAVVMPKGTEELWANGAIVHAECWLKAEREKNEQTGEESGSAGQTEG